MQISVHSAANIDTAVVSGRIDHASADHFSAALLKALEVCKADRRALLLDFSGVEYISSVGLRALMVASRQAKAQGSRIAIAALQPVVREVFTISRFDLVLPCHDTVDAAREALA